jgi:uncharacterized protein (DUF1778 family)
MEENSELIALREVVERESRPTRDLTRSQKYTRSAYALIEQAAKRAGMPAGRFIRASAIRSAKQVLNEDEQEG